MRFLLDYPVLSDADGGAWLDPANILEMAKVAEAVGIDGISFTEHPAPSRKWMDRGGHETLDPFVALAFVAAVTERVRLMTFLTVVPFRNPLLLAKTMTAVDVLSNGRGTFICGTGYLRSEFAALGVDFDERNILFDEAVEVMQAAWATDDFRHEGRHFNALGVTIMPGPVQKPHPPLWVGGNSRKALERIALWGEGWAPLVGGGAVLAQTSRTPQIGSDADLAAKIRELRDMTDANGRDGAAIDVLAHSVEAAAPAGATADQHLEEIGKLEAAGVTWAFAPVSHAGAHGSFAESLDGIRRFGEEVVAKLG